MRIAYFDPFSGASGDMSLGALVDAGLDVDQLREELLKLGLQSFELSAQSFEQHGITGTRVRVHQTTQDQHHRHWRDIRQMIEQCGIRDGAKERALRIFSGLAEAEARVHGLDIEDVHFHEVGAIDSIVDIVGVAIGLDLMGIAEVYSNTLRDGTGFVRAAHGTLPVPAPATAELIAMAHAPLRPLDVEAELLTPTGAAILTRLATFERPPFRPSAVGYGFGQRSLPWPNALRVWIGELVENQDEAPEGLGAHVSDSTPLEILLETNIDDMNPEFYEPLVARLFDEGALDVYLTPIMMKRGRPATKVSVICDQSAREQIENALFEHSTTLGVRMMPIERTKASRRIESIATRWGDVRVKLKIWNGRVTDAAPEYADCVTIVEEHGVPIRLVYGEVVRMAEAYIGRRIEKGDQWHGWQL